MCSSDLNRENRIIALEVFLIQVSFAMILFSLLLEVFKFVEEVINDILMAIVFGGILLGIGVVLL